MVKIIISAAMGAPLQKFFDNFSDDKIKSCTFESKKGIQMFYNVETDLDPETCANYMKSAFKKGDPKASAMFFSIQPQGFFG